MTEADHHTVGEFFAWLEKMLIKMPSKDITLYNWELNATLLSLVVVGSSGPGLGLHNERWRLLVEFFYPNNRYITSTTFTHPPMCLYKY